MQHAFPNQCSDKHRFVWSMRRNALDRRHSLKEYKHGRTSIDLFNNQWVNSKLGTNRVSVSLQRFFFKVTCLRVWRTIFNDRKTLLLFEVFMSGIDTALLLFRALPKTKFYQDIFTSQCIYYSKLFHVRFYSRFLVDV